MKPVFLIASAVLILGFGSFSYYSASIRETKRREHRERAGIASHQAAMAARLALFDGHESVGRDGRQEARADLARGTPRLLVYGRAAGLVFGDEEAALLKARFGVTRQCIAGCFISDPLVTYANAYNAEIKAFIAQRYGPTALATAYSDAATEWKKSHSRPN